MSKIFAVKKQQAPFSWQKLDIIEGEYYDFYDFNNPYLADVPVKESKNGLVQMRSDILHDLNLELNIQILQDTDLEEMKSAICILDKLIAMRD